MNKYSLTQSAKFATWWHLDLNNEITGVILMGDSTVQDVVSQLNKATELQETIDTQAKRIKELELLNELYLSQINEYQKFNIEKDTQIAALTVPKPIVCENCNSVIEGEIHLRYMAHDTINLCDACVIENED